MSEAASDPLMLFLMFTPLIAVFSLLTIVGGVFPLLKIFERLGLKKWRALWLFVPIINVFFLWKLARENWPNVISGGSNA
jgi:hypothetical protein